MARWTESKAFGWVYRYTSDLWWSDEGQRFLSDEERQALRAEQGGQPDAAGATVTRTLGHREGPHAGGCGGP